LLRAGGIEAPFPYIPGHVVDPKRADSVLVAHHLRGHFDVALAGVAALDVEGVAPREDSHVVAACRPYPLEIGGQGDMDVQFVAQPLAEGYRLVPAYALAGARIAAEGHRLRVGVGPVPACRRF